ncbi:hypothetical protein PM3016_6953 [Paenibacillus mucilaginosus 3016]|uniref:Copper amine oxidase-like N-terminal domain-containing protein n=1 Tax=Paenibacillus mucilaginosus 3016 TaxID=1116391 RepID=H6NRA9_9BACL|nr:hypothetical protein [Paenibacillus mucilaginosus]AFC33544.1 hypothetical protein PM3016_6953 [Paenibacillus mucilaginosus 3016]WFA21947.1 hypothetical protein ERY13_34515 [Paenibacillus mucilaginosus]
MNKNNLLLCAAGLLLMLGLQVPSALSPVPAEASAMQVDVRVPAWPVELDGITLDRSPSTYPPIVFHDITYIPMTWDVSRAAGLTLDWSAENGLTIRSGAEERVPLSPPAHGNAAADGKTLTAYVASFPITIDGRTVDLAKDPYPPLLFRNVTYFPLTWDYAVETFGWTASWDPRSGLSVRTK